MGQLTLAMATSHAFAFMDFDTWDEFRARNRSIYQTRYGVTPPVLPELERESVVDSRSRFERIKAAHERLREALAREKPDALILIGDDQNENLTIANLPQIAVYSGKSCKLAKRFSPTELTFHTHAALVDDIMENGLAQGFDIAALGELSEGTLKSHAHAQVLEALLPDTSTPVVLLFVNAIHYPAPEPRRCYALGKLIAEIVAKRPAGERIALCGSGGLSHFTAGYPWKSYSGGFHYGSISQDFDQRALTQIRAGEGRKLAELSSLDLLANGEIELRAWITVLGAVGAVKPDFTVYEPIYRALMGMGVAMWHGTAA